MCIRDRHKLRNVTDRLPDTLASVVAKRMRAAYHHPDPLVARASASSLREGLAETGHRPPRRPTDLARTLRSTNTIESMIEICRDHTTNVKRWQDGQMVLGLS